MIRYRYNTAREPPAPFVHVTLIHPTTAATRSNVPAQLDSAADRTVVPEKWIQELDLPWVDEVVIPGFGGMTHTLPTYAVRLGVHDFPAGLLKVVVGPDEPWVLLGRDVLNSFRIVHDGPKLAVDIDPPSQG